MATLVKTPLETIEPSHTFYAAADVLSAEIERPLHENIKPRVHVKLPEDGHYQFKQADPFRLDGVISYRSGYTQVAGHPSLQPDRGFTTLATSVVEDLNILDVVTADRVVGQIATNHPFYGEGQVPSVTFLGTRFDNLRIGGHKVEVDQNVDILGPKPAGDKSYLEDPGVLSRVSQQHANLPQWAKDQYRWDPAAVQQQGKVVCSLVNRVAGGPGTSLGHVIDVPHFGKIFLAELTVKREKARSGPPKPDTYRFYLTMIRLELGCHAHGRAKIVNFDTNGSGGHH
ncbi:MAG TPA: hypothetical protein VN948_07280 [Terriglobales bacterium]|nr:hypothetical protein [Terriglobales bacterium]